MRGEPSFAMKFFRSAGRLETRADALAGARVCELQFRGMQEVAFQGEPRERGAARMLHACRQGHDRGGRAIKRVPDDGMPQRSHVDTNLVGAPGLDTNGDSVKRP